MFSYCYEMTGVGTREAIVTFALARLLLYDSSYRPLLRGFDV